MKRLVHRVCLVAGAALLLAPVICVAQDTSDGAANCDTSGVAKKFGTVCLSIQNGGGGKLMIVVSPDPLSLERGRFSQPRRVWWQVANDATSKNAEWTITWEGTYKNGVKPGNRIPDYDPLEESPGQHNRAIPPAAPANPPGHATSPRGKDLDAHPEPIYWKYSVSATVNGVKLETEDPIILWPGG